MRCIGALPGSSCFIWGDVRDPGPFESTTASPIDDEGEVDIEVAEVDPVELCESVDSCPFIKVELPLCRVGNIRSSDSPSPDKVASWKRGGDSWFCHY